MRPDENWTGWEGGTLESMGKGRMDTWSKVGTSKEKRKSSPWRGKSLVSQRGLSRWGKIIDDSQEIQWILDRMKHRILINGSTNRIIWDSNCEWGELEKGKNGIRIINPLTKWIILRVCLPSIFRGPPSVCTRSVLLNRSPDPKGLSFRQHLLGRDKFIVWRLSHHKIRNRERIKHFCDNYAWISIRAWAPTIKWTCVKSWLGEKLVKY